MTGIGFTPFETRAEVVVEVAQHAERLGFDHVAVAEATTLAAPVVLAELALTTERIELSSGVLSVWGRTPATIAMTAAGLQRLSGGRFVLGLGASTAPLVEGLHGVPWRDPVARVRSVLLAVRALLAGERLPAVPDGARALRLGLPAPVPLALAAITAPSIRLAGCVADRWLPFLLPAPALDGGRELLEQGVLASGRDDRPSVTACVPVAIGADDAAAAALAARWLVFYCRSMGPVYPRVLRAWGYSAEVDALLEANDDPHRPVLPAAAERLARDVLLFGTRDDVAGQRGRWEAHADHVLLVLPFGLAPDELVDVVSGVAV